MAENHGNGEKPERSDKIRDALSEQIIECAARLAREEGAHKVSVSRIMSEMGLTNRVFYNRFTNCDAVLRIVYENAVLQMQKSLNVHYNDADSFFQFCLDAAEQVLLRTYDVKMQFSRYMFEHDSLTESNRLWWAEQVQAIYADARSKGYVREVDPVALTYAIWCFCRGYFTDAVMRKLPQDEAVRCLRFGLSCFLRGIRQDIQEEQAT